MGTCSFKTSVVTKPQIATKVSTALHRTPTKVKQMKDISGFTKAESISSFYEIIETIG